jgi:arsenate reductase-like glutaredoxin family protein
MSANQGESSKRGLIIGVACVALLAAGGVFAARTGLFGGASDELASGDTDKVIDALTSIDQEQLASADNRDARAKALDTLKNSSIESVFERLRSDDLTDEQRQTLRENMGKLMQEDMERKVDEYASAPEDQKEVIMDRHIDEMIAFRDKMRAYREKHKDDPEMEKEREGRRGRWGSQTTQQRKERMESRNPDKMAQMMRYWPKMMSRAKERGVDMGWGRGGGSGRGRGGDKGK